MSIDQAKERLRKARDFQERVEAIAQALDAGMTLREIEELLDWLDAQRRGSPPDSPPPPPTPPKGDAP